MSISHIRLAEIASVLAVVPATANVIAELALGLAGDALTSHSAGLPRADDSRAGHEHAGCGNILRRRRMSPRCVTEARNSSDRSWLSCRGRLPAKADWPIPEILWTAVLPRAAADRAICGAAFRRLRRPHAGGHRSGPLYLESQLWQDGLCDCRSGGRAGRDGHVGQRPDRTAAPPGRDRARDHRGRDVRRNAARDLAGFDVDHGRRGGRL